LLRPLSILLILFFLMLRRPPRSTLFPTRRSSDLIENAAAGFEVEHRPELPGLFRVRLVGEYRFPDSQIVLVEEGFPPVIHAPLRSEEHTSELQSRGHLVCRLLLEKKKKIKTHK